MKTALAKKIVKAVVETMEIPETSVSVGFEEIARENWAAAVYKPDIIDKAENIYVKPGYVPAEYATKS